MPRLKNVLRVGARFLMGVIVSAYVPGEDIGDAIRIAERFEQRHGLSSLAYLNAHGEIPDRIAKVDRQALAEFARPDVQRFVSVKAPALHFDKGLIGDLAEQARRHGVGIHFDSHGIAAADATLECAQHARRITEQVGVTLPAAWSRSLVDAERALRLELRHVRVVKGAFDLELNTDHARREAYLRIIDILCGGGCRVGVATHDHDLADEAIRRLQETGTPCEIELLHGLPARRMLRVAQARGVPVRLCVQYGAAWAPYSVEQVLRRPEIVGWVLKDLVSYLGGRIASAFTLAGR